MKVLVACEYSGVVRDAFIAAGHDALSCDLLPTKRPGPHYQGDVLGILKWGWDLMVAHPPCTFLCSSGLHWTRRGLRDWKLTEDALEFVKALLAAPIDKICLENPIGCISTRIRKPDQIIQPWQFGEDASKATCLWLKGLPKLVPTDIITHPLWVRCDMCEDFICVKHKLHAYDCACPPVDEMKIDPYLEGGYYANQTPSGQNKLGPSADRWAERSVTYAGIALAMASQWGGKDDDT